MRVMIRCPNTTLSVYTGIDIECPTGPFPIRGWHPCPFCREQHPYVSSTLSFEEAATDWPSAIAQIPTLFGRLAFLASFLASGLKDAEAEQLHRTTFLAWITNTLEQNSADLWDFLDGLVGAGRIRHTLERWQRFVPYKALLPTVVLPHEACLFFSDLSIIIEVLWDRASVAGEQQMPLISA